MADDVPPTKGADEAEPEAADDEPTTKGADEVGKPEAAGMTAIVG